MELKEKLVALRKEKGLTQLAVAEKLDVSRQAISRWESGIALPSTDNLRSLSVLYGVPIDYLVNEEREMMIQSENNSKKQKLSKRYLSFIFVLIMLIMIVLIGVTVMHRKNERVDFNTTEIEDWNDSEQEDIPIKW